MEEFGSLDPSASTLGDFHGDGPGLTYLFASGTSNMMATEIQPDSLTASQSVFNVMGKECWFDVG